MNNWLSGFSSLITAAGPKGKSRYGSLDFQDRFDILLEMRFGDVAIQCYMGNPRYDTMLGLYKLRRTYEKDFEWQMFVWLCAIRIHQRA
jgi:hypothetical protein